MASPDVIAAGLLAAALSSLAALPVGAACDCLCVDGEPMTVCQSTEALQSTRGLCRFRPDVECSPVAPDTPRRTYEAPVEGVGDCRDARVESPATGQRVMARVCHGRPAG